MVAASIYAPLAHWVWGGGFLALAGIGAIDFAGGTVVHISAGAAALACALYVGKRAGYPGGDFAPHNVPMVVLGAGILWFGWFGFNAGSALGAGGLASTAFIATQLGAVGACSAGSCWSGIRHGKATAVGAATGAVAGLVAITPAAGYVAPMPALLIGLAAGGVCFAAVELKPRFGYDDSLDAVGVHMVGGLVGALLTGVFASLVINPAGAEGGLVQVGASGGCRRCHARLRVPRHPGDPEGRRPPCRVPAERRGGGGRLDLAEHGEIAYAWGSRRHERFARAVTALRRRPRRVARAV